MELCDRSFKDGSIEIVLNVHLAVNLINDDVVSISESSECLAHSDVLVYKGVVQSIVCSTIVCSVDNAIKLFRIEKLINDIRLLIRSELCNLLHCRNLRDDTVVNDGIHDARGKSEERAWRGLKGHKGGRELKGRKVVSIFPLPNEKEFFGFSLVVFDFWEILVRDSQLPNRTPYVPSFIR